MVDYGKNQQQRSTFEYSLSEPFHCKNLKATRRKDIQTVKNKCKVNENYEQSSFSISVQ